VGGWVWLPTCDLGVFAFISLVAKKPKECHDRRWPGPLIRGGTALNHMRKRGQIQFQNFVATWLSRIRDRPHIFLGLGQFGTILTVVSDNHVLFGWSRRIVLKME